MSRKKIDMPLRPRSLPIALNLEDRRVLFVGGGQVTSRKIKTWTQRGAKLVVVSPQICDKLKEFISLESDILWHERGFEFSDLEQTDVAVIATSDSALNQSIAEACRKRHILFSRADGGISDFNAMALVENRHMQVGIGTGGLAPVILKTVKTQIETLISDETLERRIELLSELKDRLKSEISLQSEREAYLRKASEYSIEELERLLADEGVYRRYKG